MSYRTILGIFLYILVSLASESNFVKVNKSSVQLKSDIYSTMDISDILYDFLLLPLEGLGMSFCSTEVNAEIGMKTQVYATLLEQASIYHINPSNRMQLFSPGMARLLSEYLLPPIEELKNVCISMRDLAVQAVSRTLSDSERELINLEFQEYKQIYSDIVNGVQFFSDNPFKGDLNGSRFVDNLILHKALQTYFLLPKIQSEAIGHKGIFLIDLDLLSTESASVAVDVLTYVGLAIRKSNYRISSIQLFPQFGQIFGGDVNKDTLPYLQPNLMICRIESSQAANILLTAAQTLEDILNHLAELVDFALDPSTSDEERIVLNREFQANIKEFERVTLYAGVMFGRSPLQAGMNCASIVRKDVYSFSWVSYIWHISNLKPGAQGGVQALGSADISTYLNALNANEAVEDAFYALEQATNQILFIQQVSSE